MQAMLILSKGWTNLSGATGRDGDENITLSLLPGNNIKLFPYDTSLNSKTVRFRWYQGVKTPTDAHISTSMPLKTEVQSFAIYSGAEQFYIYASEDEARIAIIITDGA